MGLPASAARKGGRLVGIGHSNALEGGGTGWSGAGRQFEGELSVHDRGGAAVLPLVCCTRRGRRSG